MMSILEVLVPVLAVSAVILYLLTPGMRRRKADASQLNESLEELRAVHYQYFPLIRQALSRADEAFLRERLNPELANAALSERRAVAGKFLAGLHEDFLKLDRLGRMVASLSPVLDRKQETERLNLMLKFRMSYALVWTMLQLGNISLPQFEHLAGLIGQFADSLEQAMASLNSLSAEPISMSSRS